MTGMKKLDETEQSAPPGIVRVDRPVRPRAWVGRGVLTGEEFAALDGEPRSDACGPWEPLYALTAGDLSALRKLYAADAWAKRDLRRCRCDHNELCEHCFPPEFQPGGVWDGA